MWDPSAPRRMGQMSEKTPAQIVIVAVIFGLALTASALMLLIPQLFDAPSSAQIWAAVILGTLTAGFAGCALALRRAHPGSAQR